jgi:hypothetical protein
MDFLPPEKETRVDDGIEGKQKSKRSLCLFAREKKKKIEEKKKRFVFYSSSSDPIIGAATFPTRVPFRRN